MIWELFVYVKVCVCRDIWHLVNQSNVFQYIQFIDVELFIWIYLYLFATVLIEFQINLVAKYGFLVNFIIFDVNIISRHFVISTLFSSYKPNFFLLFTSNFPFEDHNGHGTCFYI